MDENRRSGRDNFVVRINTVSEEPKEIPCEVEDRNDGSYAVTYKVEEPCEVKVEILFEDDKGKLVPVRGSPYKASFSDKSAANHNILTGPAMQKYIQGGLENTHAFIADTAKGTSTKDKNIQADVKVLINVKESVESVQKRNDEIVLQLDCLDESLKMF